MINFQLYACYFFKKQNEVVLEKEVFSKHKGTQHQYMLYLSNARTSPSINVDFRDKTPVCGLKFTGQCNFFLPNWFLGALFKTAANSILFKMESLNFRFRISNMVG